MRQRLARSCLGGESVCVFVFICVGTHVHSRVVEHDRKYTRFAESKFADRTTEVASWKAASLPDAALKVYTLLRITVGDYFQGGNELQRRRERYISDYLAGILSLCAWKAHCIISSAQMDRYM